MLHVLLTHLPPRCALTFSPAPEGEAVKRLRTPPSKVLKDLLGESVPQVRVSARTLALRGFFNMLFILTPFFLDNIFVLCAPWKEVFSNVSPLALREQGKMSERILERGASRVRVTSSDDSRVDWIACA